MGKKGKGLEPDKGDDDGGGQRNTYDGGRSDGVADREENTGRDLDV